MQKGNVAIQTEIQSCSIVVFLLTYYSSEHRVARNLQWGGGLFWGVGAEPLAAVDWRSEGRAPSARKFCIFLAKITEF